MDNITDLPQPNAAGERRLVMYLSIGLSILFVLIGLYSCITIHQDKVAEDQRIQAIVESPTVPAGAPYDEAPPPGQEAEPVEVQVGIYLEQIPSFSLKDFMWTADFFIWFRWEGEGLDPGETFSILDSTIVSKEKVAESLEGTTHYTRYHVVAQVYKFFDVSRFPLSETILTLPILDSQNPSYRLRYLADEDNSGFSGRVNILEGLKATSSAALVKLLPFQTEFGDPNYPEGYRPTFSIFIYGLWVSSPGLIYYFKFFLALFISALLAISVFFIKPTDVDPRFGLGVGALFAASANAYVISSALPPSGGLVLADMVNALGILIIFLTVLESILSLYLYDIKDNQALSRRLDRVMFIIFLVGFLAINIAIPIAALI